ncbi:hypothetical protein [Epilithonimonas arachidiradicis]|uniref:hypothetical protein n=1 Tax=Epilithonimonas arachidiradicis TaxID=1617282 RepID=UPI0011C21591|nr:hypothetical protein [Epilithonimonas arachidiradicis]
MASWLLLTWMYDVYSLWRIIIGRNPAAVMMILQKAYKAIMVYKGSLLSLGTRHRDYLFSR